MQNQIEIYRFCGICLHEWKEMADRERLKEVVKNENFDCPRCNKNLDTLLTVKKEEK